MKRKVTKAVFPVAGLGSRFLPATKASPKEMMPVVDKPLIQYAVEEAVQAGITDMIFITGRHKRAIEDHFDKAYELEAELEARGKLELLDQVRSVAPKHVNFVFIRQAEQLGLGHAVLCAQHVLNDEPFAVMLADDLMDVDPGVPSVLGQMTSLFEEQGVSILAVQDVPREQTKQYGIVAIDGEIDGYERVSAIVEKPAPEEAPSTLAVVGRYILSPRIFDHLNGLSAGAGNEIQLTDAIAALLQKEAVLAYRYRGIRYDCGSKLGYLQATLGLAKKHPEVGSAFRKLLEQEKT